MTIAIDSSPTYPYRAPENQSRADRVLPEEMYTPGLMRRFLAQLVDGIFEVVAVFVGSIVLGLLGAVLNWSPDVTGAAVVLLPTLVASIIQTVLTGAYGQSVGKMLFRLRVVRCDGASCGLGRAVVRAYGVLFLVVIVSTVFRFFHVSDWITLLVMLALFCTDIIMALGEHGRRLSDRLAGTRVIELPSLPALGTLDS
jgi:uncharacterized RDD family membrane protein YckC